MGSVGMGWGWVRRREVGRRVISVRCILRSREALCRIRCGASETFEALWIGIWNRMRTIEEERQCEDEMPKGEP